MEKYEVIIHDLQSGTYTVVITNVGLAEALGQVKWCINNGEHKTTVEFCIREV